MKYYIEVDINIWFFSLSNHAANNAMIEVGKRVAILREDLGTSDKFLNS